MKTDGRFVKNVVYFRSILNELIRVFGLNHRLNVKIMKLKCFIILVKIKIFDWLNHMPPCDVWFDAALTKHSNVAKANLKLIVYATYQA